MDSIKIKLEQVNQDHLLKFYDELSSEDKSYLEADLNDVDWNSFASIYKDQVLPQTDGTSKVKPTTKIQDDQLKPLSNEYIDGTSICTKETLDGYQTTGLANIRQGKVAALVLAGGQGTRLGVSHPKGMFDIGLDSHKSLFQLQAERLLNISKVSETENQIMWYIMTSEATMQTTKEFFQTNNYFGLKEENVVLFEQQTIPCLSFDGKVLLAEKHKLSRSPDGNGGLYEALHKKGIIEHMMSKGIEFVHVYCVDNVLVRVCDPAFMGYCITKQVDAGAKVVEKTIPNESVGIICKVQNQFKVIEYSEISDNIAQLKDEISGKLVFNAGNICDHFFKVSFLQTITVSRPLRYHIAIKKIQHISIETGERVTPAQPNGIKLEKFIFDVFEFTDRFAAWQVEREDEFSPLKNADGTEKDNPTTALKALKRAYDLGILTC